MKKLTGNLFYLLKTARWDLLILPIVMLLVFTFIVWIKGSNVEQVVGGFLGFGLPLLAGIMASSVFLDIPSLEIVFSFPRTAFAFMVERLLMVFMIVSFAAISFQGLMGKFHVDLQFLGTLLNRQMTWFLPTILFIGIGCCSSLLITRSVGGTMVVSVVWILEIVAHELFMKSLISRSTFIFLSAYQPFHPDLSKNYISLMTIFFILFLVSGFLVRKAERII